MTHGLEVQFKYKNRIKAPKFSRDDPAVNRIRRVRAKLRRGGVVDDAALFLVDMPVRKYLEALGKEFPWVMEMVEGGG